MVVKLNSFKVDDISSKFKDAIESTYNILNTTLNTTIEFLFTISGLNGHTIESITFDLLFSNIGNYKFELRKDSSIFGTSIKEVNAMRFSSSFNGSGNSEENNSFILIYTVTNNNLNECDYGLYGFTITLSDTLQDLKVTFSGPLGNRTVNNIDCAVVTLNKGTEIVSFEKNPIKDFDASLDTVEGRMYLRKNGIFVDGYLYSVNLLATSVKAGIVKLSKSSFSVDDDGGIIPPYDVGVAASPQLVYNALATTKQYVDDSITEVNERVDGIQATLDGIEVPSINIEQDNGEITNLGDNLTFSNDFEQLDSKLYIKWLELI